MKLSAWKTKQATKEMGKKNNFTVNHFVTHMKNINKPTVCLFSQIGIIEYKTISIAGPQAYPVPVVCGSC